MTIADESSALVARGIAAGQLLGHVTIAFAQPGELDGPACVDRTTGTLWVQHGLPLDEVMMLAQSCLDVLVGGTIVQTEDGELDVVPTAVGAEGLTLPALPQRSHLKVVR